MFNHLTDLIIRGQVFRAQVKPLAHQKRQIPDPQPRDNFVTVEQLPGGKAQHPVELDEKELLSTAAFKGYPG